VILLIALIMGAGFVAWVKTEPARFLRAREQAWGVRIQPGDIVFQDIDCGARCQLIRDVTRSRYAHVGLVLEEHGERAVWEAFEPVGPTALAEWVSRGIDGKVAVYRLSPELLSQLPAIAREVRAMRGLPYDGNYQWDDGSIYCSELVEKAVERGTGRSLATPHPSGPGSFGGSVSRISAMTGGRLSETTPLVSPKDLALSPHLSRLVDELGGS
jgi:hypothetical protein